jgi:hypothetical protein
MWVVNTRGRTRVTDLQSIPVAPAAGLPPNETTKHLAYGEASLMLIECLMLVLIEQRVFTVAQMVDAVEAAIATKRQMVRDGEHPEIATVAAGLLSTMANSLAASAGARAR